MTLGLAILGADVGVGGLFDPFTLRRSRRLCRRQCGVAVRAVLAARLGDVRPTAASMKSNPAIWAFLVFLAALFAIAFYGWWTGAWYETPP